MIAEQAIDYSGHARPQATADKHCLRLAVEGMHCAACAFKIEKCLNAHAGVNARVNVTERRLTLVWEGDKKRANDMLREAAKLGFRFSPLRDAEAAAERQTRDILRCMAAAGFAAGNIMVFSLALWFSSRAEMGGATRDMMHWFSALITLPAVAYAGRPFFLSAWRALRGGHTNMDVPISVALVLTTGISLMETLRGGEHVYFDSVAMLLFLLLVGRYLDARARMRTRHAAADLLSLMDGTAMVVDGMETRRLPARDVTAGMVLLVAKGEKVLADGVADCEVLVDASILTGETLPQALQPGERLLAGMINLDAPFRMTVEKAQEESLIGDIVALLQKAEQGNAHYVRLADRISRWYTPAVHGLALCAFIYWLFWGGLTWQPALMIAATVLIITCPCALALAVPVAQVVAGSRLFEEGILLKTADALERLDKIDTVIFDKTGTLTTGHIVFDNAADFSAEELSVMTAMAAQSRHPLSRAVAAMGTADMAGLRVEEIAGKGLKAERDGDVWLLGSAGFTGAAAASKDHKIELWLRKGNNAPKRLVFTDALFPDAAVDIALLKKRYRVMMMSGDRYAVTADVAGRLGIDVFYAAVNPKEKFDILEAEMKKGRHVLMVGDGLNDAAALGYASASMSPSSALDIAQNAADIVYRRPGIAAVRHALEAARKTQRIVRQNFALALLYNVCAVPLALMGMVTPLVAAAAMSSSSLLVTLNALRLKKR